MYERGDGVQKSLVIACAWYTLLATATPPMGKDVREFIAHTAPAGTLEKMDRAFVNDARDAKGNAERIAQKLTAEQVEEAHNLALAWKPGKLIADSAP